MLSGKCCQRANGERTGRLLERYRFTEEDVRQADPENSMLRPSPTTVPEISYCDCIMMTIIKKTSSPD